jgi:hypothetical protein
MKGLVLFKWVIIRKNVKIGWGYLKIFFSRTTKPEKLRFTQKLPNNHCRRGSGGTTMGKTIFTCVYIGKKTVAVV